MSVSACGMQCVLRLPCVCMLPSCYAQIADTVMDDNALAHLAAGLPTVGCDIRFQHCQWPLPASAYTALGYSIPAVTKKCTLLGELSVETAQSICEGALQRRRDIVKEQGRGAVNNLQVYSDCTRALHTQFGGYVSLSLTPYRHV